jgi:hypothetical protein
MGKDRETHNERKKQLGEIQVKKQRNEERKTKIRKEGKRKEDTQKQDQRK